MTINEYNSLKEIDTKAVLDRMKGMINWTDEDGYTWDDDTSMIVICFILWNIKRKEHYKTVEEYYKYCAGEERHEFFDDILSFLDATGQWEKFISLKNQFSNEELAAAVLFTRFENGCERTPICLLPVIDGLLGSKNEDAFAEFCANDFEYTFYKGLKHKNMKIDSYEDLYSNRAISEARRQVLGLDNVSINGQIEEPVMSDRIFVNMGEWNTVSDVASNEYAEDSEGRWKGLPAGNAFVRDICIAVLSSLKEHGRAVILMRSGQLSGKEDEQVRKFLVESGWVSGVIALADKLYERTWVNTYILVLEKGKKSIKFYDARDKFEKSRIISGKQVNIITEEDANKIAEIYESGNGLCKDVQIDEVKENDYVLLPQRYVSASFFQHTKKIGDCVREVSRGITLSGKESDEFLGKGGIKCITPMSLSNGIIVKPFYFDKEAFGRKVNYAMPGDVLINKAGKPIRTAVADDYYAVVGNTFILKLEYGVNPYYIKCFFESPKGQEEIMKYVVGESAPVLTVTNLEKIEIPVFEKEKQAEMEKRAEQYTRELQTALNKMDELQDMFE